MFLLLEQGLREPGIKQKPKPEWFITGSQDLGTPKRGTYLACEFPWNGCGWLLAEPKNDFWFVSLQSHTSKYRGLNEKILKELFPLA